MRLLTLLFLVLLSPALAVAGPLEDAKAAYARGGSDYQVAFSLFQPLAEQGNVEAQLYLGKMYAEGITIIQTEKKVIVPKDETEALKWFRKAADKDNAFAQGELGSIYARGLGVPKDTAASDEWFRKGNATDDGKNPVRKLWAPSPAHNYMPPKGVIPDKATAIEVARAILKSVYGESAIQKEEPLVAAFQDGLWKVSGTMPPGMLGGVAEIHIEQATGAVIRITHGM